MLARTHSPKAPNMSMKKYFRTEVSTVCEVTEPAIITAAQAQHEGLIIIRVVSMHNTQIGLNIKDL